MVYWNMCSIDNNKMQQDECLLRFMNTNKYLIETVA